MYIHTFLLWLEFGKLKAKNINRIITYFIYTIIFILFLKYGYEYGFYNLQKPGSKYLEYYLFGRKIVFTYLVLYFALIGILLAVPHFIDSIKEQGAWKFDWVIFLAVCVPSLYVSVTPWIPQELWPYWPLRAFFGLWGNLLQNITVTLFTYFLLTSFKKSKNS